MRILHVTDHFPPTLGGIEAHVSSLAARQAARGHDVTVLTCRRDADLASAPATTYEVIRARTRLEVGVDAGSYDVVQAHLSVVAPFTAPVTARLARLGALTIATVHSIWTGPGRAPGWAAALSGLASAPVLWTAVSAAAAASVARQLHLADADVRVLRNAVDVTARAATPARRDDFRLITTMRLARRKRPLALVRILGTLVEHAGRDVHLTVVGDGPQQQRLVRSMQRRGLASRISMPGRATSAEVLDLLRAADAYVAPARLESFGLAALEARSTGLPVVGYAGNGLAEFVEHGREGLLADTDAGLSRQLVRLAREPELLHTMSEHNRTFRPGLTWSHALDAHEAIYAEAAQLARWRRAARMVDQR